MAIVSVRTELLQTVNPVSNAGIETHLTWLLNDGISTFESSKFVRADSSNFVGRALSANGSFAVRSAPLARNQSPLIPTI